MKLTTSLPFNRSRLFGNLLLLGFVLLGGYYAFGQWREGRFVRETTRRALAGVPSNKRAQVIAIRDYLRTRITFTGAPLSNRPFLRASAADTLRSRRGYCGEVSRTFICMAGSVGINAQRINLYGPNRQHVVAEAEIGPAEHVVVDAQNPPYVQNLDRLDDVIRRPEFNDYYTLNLRRLRISWLVTRVKLHMGPLTYWSENPAALKSFLFFSIAAMILALRAARVGLRRFVVSRGWIHVTDLPRVRPEPHADNVKPLPPSQSSQPPAFDKVKRSGGKRQS